MSEYRELIKRFDKIRDYMRDFYVYGFKSREDFTRKSLRSYDNEKRRIETYLADHMAFAYDQNGKKVFLSVDSSEITENPLYRLLKVKSFTKNDITLHFLILDILYTGQAFSVSEITDYLYAEYIQQFTQPLEMDCSTVRNKLNEYVRLGILEKQKQGRKLVYFRCPQSIAFADLHQTIQFFSAYSPLGVLGDFLLDQMESRNTLFSLKHRYIMHILEAEILLDLLRAMQEQRAVQISNHKASAEKETQLHILPLRIIISTHSGRRYVAGYCYKNKSILTYRLDYIKSVKMLEICPDYPFYLQELQILQDCSWGTALQRRKTLEKLKVTFFIRPGEEYVVKRLQRERRQGNLQKMNDTTYIFSISLADTREIKPWLRTFIGRILDLECSNIQMQEEFFQDIQEMYTLYGLEGE